MPSNVMVSQLIGASMRSIGALASGETPTAEELEDGLYVLQDMLEDWSTQELAVWGQQNQTFNTIGGQALYTIGPMGDFNTTRPIRIPAAYCSFGSVDFPIEIISQEFYNWIELKSMQQPIVERLLYVNDFPLGAITLWPVPDQVIPLTLSIDRVLDSAITLTTVLTGPPGFVKALRSNTAVELCPEFDVEPSDVLVQTAINSLANYKRANMKIVEAAYDSALVTRQGSIWQRGY